MVNAGKNPPSVLPRTVCAVCSHLILWSSMARAHPYDDFLLFGKVVTIIEAQKGQRQEHAVLPSTEKWLTKNFSFALFLLVFSPLCYTEILKISTCKDQKIIREQREVPSIISLEALQHYFEGTDHKILLNLWGRIIPFKMHTKITPW